ncbi:MAG: UDP-glucose 4-epimerase GalE [Verrucomicrobiota bacterium]
MKKIFVTGGAGYIGSVCTEALLNDGYKVIVFDNLSEGHADAVDPRAELIEGDLLDHQLISKKMVKVKPDAVIHFAGKALVPESMSDPGLYYRVNVQGGVNLLDAMKAAGCQKIVFSSTCATYGLPEKMPMDERTPQKPINPYGHSKLVFEQILAWYAQLFEFNYIALRYFNAAGASKKFGEHHRVETHLIPNVLKVAQGKSDFVQVFGDSHATPDGTCIRDYIHVLDLASAHIAALDYSRSGHFNLGTGQGHSVLQVIEAARKVTGHEIPIKMKPARAGDPPSLVAAPHRLKMEMEWKAKYLKITDIVESAWDWHEANPEGYSD